MLHFTSHAKKLIPVALMAAFVGLAPQVAPAQVFVSVRIGPPALPIYVQPPCPTPGYLWSPGYWGFGGGIYAWHGGYWGPHVGFYGGVNYGFGYGGFGFVGGGWAGGVFR